MSKYDWMMTDQQTLEFPAIPADGVDPTTATDNDDLEPEGTENSLDQVIQDPTAVPATESLDGQVMAPGQMLPSMAINRLNIRISPREPKVYRVYFKASDKFTTEYINRICSFLDSLTDEYTVEFYLGCSLVDKGVFLVGSIIAAIQACAAKTKAIACGGCGVPETFIWMVCQERTIYDYGALSFGGAAHLDSMPEDIKKAYQLFLGLFFRQAVAIGCLSQEEATTLLDNRKSLMLTQQDLVRRGFK